MDEILPEIPRCARDRRAPPPQGRLRALADRAAAGDRPRARPSPGRCSRRDAPSRGAAARHRQARDPSSSRAGRQLPPPRRQGAVAASACRRCASTPTRSRRSRSSSSSICGSSATRRAPGPIAVRRYVRDAGRGARAPAHPHPGRRHARNARPRACPPPTTTSSGASPSSPRRRSSTRCVPSSTATASRRSSASAGREVGEAYRFLLDLRLDEGHRPGCRGGAPARLVGRARLSDPT
jgi:hypothetical protein